VAGLRVASTGVVDYGDVCRAFARDVTEAGSEVRFGAEATAITRRPDGLVIGTTAGDFTARFLVNCAGLQSDRITKLDGQPPPARIVPFRGEYYELVPERRHLVRGLVYPVPNPDFPFLGVHFTRMIDGSVHAGPNAVPALKREGYRKRDISFRDTADTLTYGGFWRLAARNAGEGLKEVYRSLSKAAFVKTLQRLVPEVTADDVVPAGAGVRAQALLPSGVLVDDFLIVEGDRSVHVCNAPSPAATASIEIGRSVADHLPPDLGRS
jgi:L-2-hydroxyglutarate oxidase